MTTDWTCHWNCAVSTLAYSLMWNDIMFPLFLDKLKPKLTLNMSCGFDLSLCLWFTSLRKCYRKISANCLFLTKRLSFIGVNLGIFVPRSISAFPDAWHERKIGCLTYKWKNLSLWNRFSLTTSNLMFSFLEVMPCAPVVVMIFVCSSYISTSLTLFQMA